MIPEFSYFMYFFAMMIPVIILLISGILKIDKTADTMGVLLYLNIFPESWHYNFARMIVVSEILISVGWLSQIKTIMPFCHVLVVLYYIVFVMIAIKLYIRKYKKDCGCFGGHFTMSAGWHLVLNIILTGASITSTAYFI